jgi:hypothetical protein
MPPATGISSTECLARHDVGSDKEMRMRKIMGYLVGHFTDLERDGQGRLGAASTRVLGAIKRDGGGM